jgi:NAD(P)-dependent dehydrogenase (short-subunit alcohol dehydrogenase family)
LKEKEDKTMGKIVLVTGGSRGIGASTCRLLAENGYDVAVNYRDDKAAAEAVADAVCRRGGRSVVLRADVGVEDEVISMFETVDRELGTLDALVNNAGVTGRKGRVDALSEADIISVLRTNVVGSMICCREAVRRMSTNYGGRGGAIVNVSSGSAYIGNPGSGVIYAVSKGGLNSLMIGLSQEVAGEGIRVNNISPGLTRTEMVSEASAAEATGSVPMGRLGEAGEIAEGILWLLSEKSGFVAGANIRISGGRP